MSSQWTSKFAIMRDLSVAQGRDVPVDVEGTVAADDKPPALKLSEDTEEAFFHHGTGDGYIDSGPDLCLIKHMLDMVRDKNISSDEEDNTDNVIAISKLNPMSVEFIPPEAAVASTPVPDDTKSPKRKNKQNRNCAIISLLQAIEDGNTKEEKEMEANLPDDMPLRLLRPDDFISETPEVNVAVEKVNGWLDTQTSVPENKSPKQKKCAGKLILESTNMFKRKGTEKLTKAVKYEAVVDSSPQICGTYRPSTLANEYYKKFVERSKLNEAIQDDIWTRAEKKMKEIDSKKIVEAERSSSSSQKDCEDIPQNLDKLEVVRLPKHRHLLTGECVVCAVKSKNELQVKE